MLVKMIITDESGMLCVTSGLPVLWLVKPVPLSDDEIRAMGVEQVETVVDYEIGDSVRVIDGPLENFIGTVEEISMDRKKVRVLVSMFGRETPVELEFTQIQKL